jgi:hypothetical protein
MALVPNVGYGVVPNEELIGDEHPERRHHQAGTRLSLSISTGELSC